MKGALIPTSETTPVKAKKEQRGAIGIALLVYLLGGSLGLAVLIFLMAKAC